MAREGIEGFFMISGAIIQSAFSAWCEYITHKHIDWGCDEMRENGEAILVPLAASYMQTQYPNWSPEPFCCKGGCEETPTQ